RIEAHIGDGDLVLVRRQDSAQPNDIVVAMVESEVGGETEATVKRFMRDGSRVVLKPENQTMAPIVVDPSRRAVTILGKVIGLLRGICFGGIGGSGVAPPDVRRYGHELIRSE